MPDPARNLTARQFFSRSGPLSRWHPNYEFRQGQQEMAEAVEAALNDRRHLIIEAGTGTGKTLAYLVPAILSGKRIVVSTGTKALQDQLFYKDIPFLARHFGTELRVCYMKGRANYACRQKIYDADREPILSGLEEVTDFQVIREWEKTTETGDRSEIRQLREASTAWHKIDARRELCSGQKCTQFERCFITQMHQRALESDIIIVNHHLFFADLAVKEGEYAGIIPEYAAVIFDEAHEIEDIAGQYFGFGISNYQFLELSRDIAAVSRRKNFGTQELDRVLISLQDRSDQFFALFPPIEGRVGFDQRPVFVEEHAEAYQDVLISLELLETHLKLIPNSPEELIPLVSRTREIHDRLETWMTSTDESLVFWIERRGRGMFLQATPIDVSKLLGARLFQKLDTIVLTSATLAVSGSFEFVENRLGMQNNRSAVVASPFDFQQQSLMYVPQHLPDPRSPAFSRAAAEEIIRLLQASDGRAFVLTTSNQAMNTLHDLVSMRVPYQTFVQGSGPKVALLEEFKNTPNSVLFATSSFWQGVDVPGEQLSMVIIDKLPFAVPSDPVVESRSRWIRQNGGNPFSDYQVPQAVIALKQGFGRLIRSKSDRGVLVILDNRITKQRYGQIFFDSLPDYGFTLEFADVVQFFESLADGKTQR